MDDKERKRVLQDIKDLYKKLNAREGKYVRNFNRYVNNGARRESIWTLDLAPIAYVNPAVNTEGTQTQINVIKSIIDTVVSKISQAKVRPFFDAVNGDYDTGEVCREMQHFWDFWMDEQHAYPKSVMSFRDACISDMGVAHLDAETKSILRVAPWEYFLDPAEYNHGTVSRCMWYRQQYPLIALMDRTDNDELKASFEKDPHEKGKYAIYWDLYNGKKWEFYFDKLIREPQDIKWEKYGAFYRRPFVEMFFTKPLRGFYSTSLVDDLYTMQRQVDEMAKRFDAATRKTALQWIFLYSSGGLKPSKLENDVTAYEIKGGQDGGGAPVVMNPQPIHEQQVELFKMYVEQMYNLAGVSQLSAQSQKPTGLNSGRGLETLEDIESDRFNTQLQQFTHFLVDITRLGIDIFKGSDNILPEMAGRQKISWNEVRKQRDQISISFGAASALSKDPNEKLAQVQQLIAMGMIDKAEASDKMDLPDIQGAYSLASSSYKNCARVINKCIKEGDIEYPPTINLEMLKGEIIKKLNQLQSVGDKTEYINRLIELLTRVVTDMEKLKTIMKPQEPKPNPPPPAQTAYDSGQGGTLVTILQAVTAKTLPAQSAIAAIAALYPGMNGDLVKQMVMSASQPLNVVTGPQGAVA